MNNANQPGAAWGGPGDPFVLVAGHLVSPQDGFGEIGRMANGDLRRPSRMEVGTGGMHALGNSDVIRFGAIPVLSLQRANGTEAVPTAVLVGEEIGRFVFRGHDGVASGMGARWSAVAAETWAVGAHGTRMVARTTPIGSAAGVDRWTMQAAGHLVAATDNVLDIGASGANRPRNLFMAGTGNFGGTITPSIAGGSAVGTESLPWGPANFFGTALIGQPGGGSINVGGVTATASFQETDAAVDNRIWDITANGEQFAIRAVNDAYSAANNFISVTRTGVVIDVVTFPGTSVAVGNLEIDDDLNHDGANVGFYGTAPVALQTGVAVSAAGIHAALVNLGLITA